MLTSRLAGRSRDGAGEAQPRPRLRILAVEDDDRSLLALREVLEPVTEEVCADSGLEALRHLLRDEFAVIFLDVLMPEMDDYGNGDPNPAKRAVAANPYHIPLRDQQGRVHLLQGYDTGAVDFVFKPFGTPIRRSKVAVFVDLFEKTHEVQENAAREQKLLKTALKAQAEKLEAEATVSASKLRQEAIFRALPVVFHSRRVEAPQPTLFWSDSI